MFIAIAGIDVGESYGSPDGRAKYSALYDTLVNKRGLSPKPVLLGRSRGGLMLFCWACENADKVGGIAGIFPVCNIASYPGVEKAATAYRSTAEELQSQLPQHNPPDRLEALAKAKVPLFAASLANASESRIKPAMALPLRGSQPLAEIKEGFRLGFEPWFFLALIGLLLSTIEWALFHRRAIE